MIIMILIRRMMLMRTRRMKIDIGFIETVPHWANSKLTFRNWRGKDRIEAVITIQSPQDLAYLRRELDKITAHWKEKLG